MNVRVMKFLICLLLIAWSADASAMSGVKSRVGAVHPLITQKSGYVTIKGAKLGVWEPVVENTLVLSSDFIDTGANSWVRLDFMGGSIELYGSSLLYIPSIKGENGESDILNVTLLKGTARFHIARAEGGKPFEFRTENTIGNAKNTMFLVTTADQQTDVGVLKGEIILKNPNRDEPEKLFLSKGQAVKILYDGKVNGVGAFNTDKAYRLLAKDVVQGIFDEERGSDETGPFSYDSGNGDVGGDGEGYGGNAGGSSSPGRGVDKGKDKDKNKDKKDGSLGRDNEEKGKSKTSVGNLTH